MLSTLGRYELVAELGRGGMAEVFLALRRGPGGVEKRLAIKRIRRERASDPRLLSMFVDEARLSMTMVHKNIVPMFDFGRAGDELFLVMEYVEGADLGAALRSAREHSNPLAHEVAAFVAMEACQALDYAHTMSGENQNGRVVIHRDVNPRNVLLSYAGEVKLVDFGVATTETDLGDAGKVRGTPAYMAPEQARADAVDARTDVFAVGLVLWEALAGRRAYGSGSIEQTLSAARAAEVPALPESVPARLRTIVAKATTRDIDARYASARELQLQLDEYLVAARAADSGGAPLAHRLATWLREVCPPASREGSAPSGEPAPDGRVVTFLDHGEAEVERLISSSQGITTQRSIAETLAEEQPPVAEADRQKPPATTSGRGRLALGLALGGAVVAAAVALVIGSLRAGGSPDQADDANRAAESAVSADAGAHTVEVSTGDLHHDASLAPSPADSGGGTTADVGQKRKPPSGRAQRPIDARAPTSTGTLRVSTSPWARVSVVGRSEGCAETPCEIALPPGTYKLRLLNPLGGQEKITEVRVAADETIDVVENLTR